MAIHRIKLRNSQISILINALNDRVLDIENKEELENCKSHEDIVSIKFLVNDIEHQLKFGNQLPIAQELNFLRI